MTTLTGQTDAYGVYSYKEDLIHFKAENFRDWRHRELRVQKDFLINAYIKKLNEEIFTERPIFTPDIFGGKSDQGDLDEEKSNESLQEDGVSRDKAIEPKPEVAEQDVSEDWDRERWDQLMLRMFDTARPHSWCVVDLYDSAPYWRVFGEREVEYITYDTSGVPIGCHVSWTLELPKSQGIFINFEDDLKFFKEGQDNDGSSLFVPFGVPKGNRLGEYDIENCWSLAIDAGYINLDITNNSAKTSGFYHLVYGDSLKKGDSQSIVNAMDIVGSNRAIGAKEGALKEIKAIHPEKAEFAIEALLAKLKLFAATTRLPLTFYVGEKESGGVFTEGFTDEAKVDKKKKYIFGLFKPYIKDLVMMRWGIDLEDVEVYIEETEMESFEFGQEEEDKNSEDKKTKEA